MWLVRSGHIHGRFSADSDLHGVQKFHVNPVPRIGGLAIIISLAASWAVQLYLGRPVGEHFLQLLIVVFPAFASGLFEDISKRGGVILRMACIIVSALLAFSWMGIRVTRLDLPGIDTLLAFPAVSLLFTVIALAGVTNAMNFIDGYNGLAAAVAAIMLTGIAYVAILQADYVVWPLAIAGIGACLGFLFWNWPRGLIFLGDGGAYLLGFWIAALVIMLVARNPQVSPWFAFLLVSYPVVETVFTVLRRLSRQSNPGMPDAAHLHQLVYKRLMRWAVGSPDPRHKVFRNSMTSPYLWLLSSLGVVPAVLFWNNTLALQLWALLFVFGYVWLYRCIARFRAPRWLVVRRAHRGARRQKRDH
ncbi:MraY family glycosyltransferase [Silvimonas iriomotensis]|uniref:Glycosyl transferase n=1 Tax=Silvimonas iriomotensis TaxID=449662 RepID=A0ABQ2PDP8_9NEIS|nr:glycosyltransferase [Silvimonas iriomotensis]GGP23630.1 glycosyl transferase [Silvimonas iriomotensis]